MAGQKTPADRDTDRTVQRVMAPSTLGRETRAEMDASERMWHQRWLLQFGAGLLVIVFVVGGIFWFVYRGRSQEAARLAEQEAQVKTLAEATRREVGELLSQGKVSDAILALEAASQKGLPQDASVDLDREIKAALTTETTKEVKDQISKRQFHAAILALQKACEKGLPNTVRLDLDKEIKASLAADTTAKVKETLSEHEYKEAEFILDKARQNELPREIATDIESEIMGHARAYRDELMQKAESAKKDGDLAASEKLLAEIEGLSQYVHAGKLDETREARGKTVLEQSRAAAAEGNWDQAIELLEKARRLPQAGSELTSWEEDLRRTVGGRLLVHGTPEKATLNMPGHDQAKFGQTITGLKPGKIEFVVQAKGYIPQVLIANVDFPKVTAMKVELIRASARPIWAVSALTGHAAQKLAAECYLRIPKNKNWKQSFQDVIKSDAGSAGKKKAAAKPDNLPEAVDGAMKAFAKQKKGYLRNLDKLAEFVAETPGALEGLLSNKEHSTAISECLARIEQGCAACLGEGRIACVDCKGIGKRKEMGVCLACNGKVQKTCITCKGTSSVSCKTCNGTGTVHKSRSVPGQMLKQQVQEKCPKCRGAGSSKCTNCQGGTVTCTKCKGTGQSNEQRSCSTCSGQGGRPCEVCGATGDREKMNPAKRLEAEQAAARLGGKTAASD